MLNYHRVCCARLCVDDDLLSVPMNDMTIASYSILHNRLSPSTAARLPSFTRRFEYLRDLLLNQVLVLGQHFRHSSRLACRFGPSGVDPRTVVPGIFLNSSALLCISPPRLTPPELPVGALAAVEVTNNAAVGGNAAPWSTFSRSGVFFRYESVPKITSVIPHLGPVPGNFSVRVAGGPFPDTTELRWAGVGKF